jgi:hypothetical protein
METVRITPPETEVELRTEVPRAVTPVSIQIGGGRFDAFAAKSDVDTLTAAMMTTRHGV